MLMKKFFTKCALFLAMGAMSLGLNAADPGDDLTSSFQNADFSATPVVETDWTVTSPKWVEEPVGSGTWVEKHLPYQESGNNITVSQGAAGELGFTATWLKAESSKKFANFTVAQTAENMPFGDYEVSGTIYAIEETNYGKGALYLEANGVQAKANKSSADGGAKVTVTGRVIDGTLTVKFLHDKNNRNTTLGFGDLKVVYKGAPVLADILAVAEELAAQKMNVAVKAELDAVIADAKAHSGELDSAYMALCTALEALNASVPTSVKAYADYAAIIATAEEAVANSTKADKAEIEALVASHKAAYEAGELTSTSAEISALNQALFEFDATYKIVNPYFNDGLNGWTLDTVAKQAGNHIVVEYIEYAGNTNVLNLHDDKNHKQAFKKMELSQTVTGLINGDYYVSCKVQRHEDNNYGKGNMYLYANDKPAKVANGAEGRFETPRVKVRVSDGTLTIKLSQTDGRNGWYAIDDFSLEYVGFESWAKVNGSEATASCLEEFIDALKYDGYDSENVTITITTGDTLKVGSGYRDQNAAIKNLTIKSTANTKIQGTLAASHYNMESLTIEGITFVGGGNPIQMMNGNDTIHTLTVKGCTFDKLGSEQIALFRAGNGYLGKFIFTENIVNEYGYGKQDGGNHPFQFNQKNFTVSELIFTENQFLEYGGKQFINFSNAAPAGGTDSIMHLTFEHNLLYGFSGNGWWSNKAQYRNFLEFTCGTKYNWKGVDVNINNNLFYELNHTCDSLGIANRLALAGAPEGSTVNVLNNVFFPDSMMAQVEMGKTMEDCNLPIYENEALKANRNDLKWEYDSLVLGEKYLQTHPLFTAGTNGTYVGIRSMYYDFAATATGATVSTAEGLKQAMAYTYDVESPVITMLDCTDEGGVYVLGGGYKTLGGNKNYTIKAAAGATPKVNGTLAASKFRLDSYTIEGLTFIGGTPIQVMNGNDTINVLTVKGCTFDKFGSDQIGLFRAGNGYVGKFIFTENIVNEYGYGKQDGGNHPFQFNNGKFTISELEFTENQFIEYGGKQFINFSNAAPAGGSDSIMHITFEHNTLYGFSGNGWWNGLQYRNFLEFTCGTKYGWKGADININNNLFYELNHTCDSLGIANRLALGTDGTTETYKVNVLNNVFYPDSMMAQVEMGKTMESCNLPIFDNENIKANRNDLTLAALGLTPETIWYNGKVLTIAHTSPLMTAGTEGTYVGAKANYVKDVAGIPTVAYITTNQVMGEGAVQPDNDPIFNYLNEGYDFNMVLVQVDDAKSADIEVDLSLYDAAIIAEQFAGDAKALTPDGPLAINKLTIPTIYNKAYAFKSKRALTSGGSATGADANVASLVVAKENQAWGLFDGITFDGDSAIVVFKELTDDNGVLGGEKSVKGINYVKGIDNLMAGKLARPAGIDDATVSACINYVPAGTAIASETTMAPMFIFGMNSGAICANGGENITEDGLKLWKNALNTLLGNIDETPRNLVGLKKVAYVTKNVADMAEGSEDAVYAALAEDATLNLVKVITDGSIGSVNLEGYEAIIIQEAMGGGDKVLTPEGELALANLPVPTIYNKMYAMKDGRAFTSVGKAATGKEAGETVLSITKTANSNLFDGVFAEGATEAAMFIGTTNDKGAEGVKALNYAAGVEAAGTQLAVPTGVEASVFINYIKAGEILGDATLKTNVLTMGMNYGAISKPGNMTEANIQLWKNALNVMLNGNITIEALPVALDAPVVLNNVFANNGIVYVNAAATATVNVYTMTGSLVKSVEVKEGLNSINGLNAGQVYMIRCNDEVSKVIL